MINLIAKKRIGFTNRETKEVLIAEPLVYATMPDWIVNDPIYNWAKEDGSIEVIEDKKSTKKNVKNDVTTTTEITEEKEK